MGRTFIPRLLSALFKKRTIFKRKKEENAISETKDQDTTRNKTVKTANARSKANLKEKIGAGAEVETEEKIRSCAAEIKNCIDLINSSGGAPGKPKGGRGRTNVNNRKADKSVRNRKASDSRNSDKGMKKSKQGVSPAEMVILLAKAEEKLSKAVAEAKEKEDKKRKEKKKN